MWSAIFIGCLYFIITELSVEHHLLKTQSFLQCGFHHLCQKSGVHSCAILVLVPLLCLLCVSVCLCASSTMDLKPDIRMSPALLFFLRITSICRRRHSTCVVTCGNFSALILLRHEHEKSFCLLLSSLNSLLAS